MVLEKGKEGVCPKCGSLVDYEGHRTEDAQHGEIGFDVTCQKCGWTGKEWYGLVYEGFEER